MILSASGQWVTLLRFDWEWGILLLDNIASLRRRMLFDFLWNTGARINEALAVTPKDIVLDAVKPFVVLRTLKQRNQTAGRRGRTLEFLCFRRAECCPCLSQV